MAQVKAKPNRFTLYYFPTSYSSQKVLLAFYEKEVAFKPKLVSLFSGQHNAPWYVKLNPEGAHIPVLKDGNTIITEPDKIIDYIDSNSESSVPKLIPDQESELGKEVTELRRRLQMVEVDIITYGIIYHPHLSPVGCQIQGAVMRSMRENFANRLAVLTDLAAKHPALRDSYLMKSQTAAQKFDVITDAAQVQRHLEELQLTINAVEQQLKSVKESSPDIADDLWLFGPMYTVADISLTVLLSRLALLGLNNTYFSQDNNPYTHNYYNQVKKRPTYLMIQKEITNLRMTLLWENLKTASPYLAGLAGLGILGTIGYFIYKKWNE
ncbi:ganglioside-induced differentiation-associated protein 1-like [Ylistrum balloti]|uniref:ganglioside-induced differentiation-associated protein 1-like n=1 Tax=Ylistrum balloti TaxID=509963 RepID=UPI002905D1C4|nr:ganglioside-induced differentiation-associated protein 1-like [Ylistrum balloti]